MSGYYLSILQGALLTVGVSLASLVVAILLGLVGAAAKLSGRPPLVALATVYTTVVRGVPELVLMLLIFYGGTILRELTGDDINERNILRASFALADDAADVGGR